MTSDEQLVLAILSEARDLQPMTFLSILDPFKLRGGRPEWLYSALFSLVRKGRVEDVGGKGVGPFRLAPADEP